MGFPSSSRSIAGAVLVSLIAGNAFAQVPTGPVPPTPPATPMTLGQAIDLALSLQPQLTAAGANVAAASEHVTEARAAYLPSVTPQYNYLSQYNFGSVQQFTTTTNGTTIVSTQQGESSTSRSAQLGLAYRLFDTGARALNARAARQQLRAEGYGAAATRQSVIGGVADAYYTALQTAALLKVSQQQVDREQNTLDVVAAQVEAGTSPRKDIFQARADLANAKVSLLLARNNAAVSDAQLKLAIGIVGGQPLTLADVAPPPPTLPATAVLAPDVQAALNVDPEASSSNPTLETTPSADAINRYASVAYTSRPDIAQARQNVDLSQTTVDQAKVASRLLVTSDIAAALLIDPTKFNREDSNNRQINVFLTYPLFDGGFARAQVRAAKDTKRASEAQLEILRQQVALGVEQAYRNLTQARAGLPAAQSAQEAAQINYDAALEARKEGVGSVVDVITAQTALVQAQTNYVQAVYAFYLADERLATAVGQADRIAARAGSTLVSASADTRALMGVKK